jgi:hypothetical protein
VIERGDEKKNIRQELKFENPQTKKKPNISPKQPKTKSKNPSHISAYLTIFLPTTIILATTIATLTFLSSLLVNRLTSLASFIEKYQNKVRKKVAGRRNNSQPNLPSIGSHQTTKNPSHSPARGDLHLDQLEEEKEVMQLATLLSPSIISMTRRNPGCPKK